MDDALVIGSGPNGLAAAATLAQAGWRVRVLETQPRPGGALYSLETTLPGYVHDVGAAFFPFAQVSPALQQLLGSTRSASNGGSGVYEAAHPRRPGRHLRRHRARHRPRGPVLRQRRRRLALARPLAIEHGPAVAECFVGAAAGARAVLETRRRQSLSLWHGRPVHGGRLCTAAFSHRAGAARHSGAFLARRSRPGRFFERRPGPRSRTVGGGLWLSSSRRRARGSTSPM